MTDTNPNPFAKPWSTWEPTEAGERVYGTVFELSEQEGKHGVFPVVVVETDDELVTVEAKRSVLEKEIRNRDIRLGDAIAFEFQGEKTKLDGGQFYLYKVLHKPATPRDELPRVPTIHDNDDELPTIDEVPTVAEPTDDPEGPF